MLCYPLRGEHSILGLIGLRYLEPIRKPSLGCVVRTRHTPQTGFSDRFLVAYQVCLGAARLPYGFCFPANPPANPVFLELSKIKELYFGKARAAKRHLLSQNGAF